MNKKTLTFSDFFDILAHSLEEMEKGISNKREDSNRGFISFHKAHKLMLEEGVNISRNAWRSDDIYVLNIIGDCIRKALKDNYGDPDKTLEEFYQVKDFHIKVNKKENSISVYNFTNEDILADDWYVV